MRQYKFRAWDKKNNRYWYQFDISSLYGSAYFSGLPKEWIVEQFTGLTDKNGIGCIYEGDYISLDGIITGNIHETLDRKETDIIVPSITSREWNKANKKMLDRKCKYA